MQGVLLPDRIYFDNELKLCDLEKYFTLRNNKFIVILYNSNTETGKRWLLIIKKNLKYY